MAASSGVKVFVLNNRRASRVAHRVPAPTQRAVRLVRFGSDQINLAMMAAAMTTNVDRDEASSPSI
jgi:hypothetical protein